MDKVELKVRGARDWNVPPCVLSCNNEEITKPNLITLGAWSIACLRPLMFGVGIGHARYSYDIIKKGDSFVINIPYSNQTDIVDYCGSVSGRDRDKYSDCSLTPLKSLKVSSSGITEFALNLEFSKYKEVVLGSHSFFFGTLEAVQCDESILDENGLVSETKFSPLAAFRNKYWTLGDHVMDFGEGRKKIKMK